MTLTLLPDVEALAITWLRSHASVSALVGARVHTKLPAAPTFPLLLVRAVTGSELVIPHLDETVLGLQAYADNDPAAYLLARTARAALLEAPGAEHPRGIVTGARTVLPPVARPDDTATPTRPRYVVDVALMVHPHPPS